MYVCVYIYMYGLNKTVCLVGINLSLIASSLQDSSNYFSFLSYVFELGVRG